MLRTRTKKKAKKNRRIIKGGRHEVRTVDGLSSCSRLLQTSISKIPRTSQSPPLSDLLFPPSVPFFSFSSKPLKYLLCHPCSFSSSVPYSRLRIAPSFHFQPSSSLSFSPPFTSSRPRVDKESRKEEKEKKWIKIKKTANAPS